MATTPNQSPCLWSCPSYSHLFPQLWSCPSYPHLFPQPILNLAPKGKLVKCEPNHTTAWYTSFNSAAQRLGLKSKNTFSNLGCTCLSSPVPLCSISTELLNILTHFLAFPWILSHIAFSCGSPPHSSRLGLCITFSKLSFLIADSCLVFPSICNLSTMHWLVL